MAIKQPKGKTVRRLGVNIYGNPKYDKLLDRKPNGPGKERGARKRGKTSVYGEQLKEKQKFRFAYGISERQFRNLYKKASRMPGVTGDNMISLMEQRLDNTIYRMGFAISRAQARQMVTHAYFFINGKPVNIPSMCVSVNDVITTKNKKDRLKVAKPAFRRPVLSSSKILRLIPGLIARIFLGTQLVGKLTVCDDIHRGLLNLLINLVRLFHGT